MSSETELQEALRRIERLEGALMGVDCFIHALLKTLPPETSSQLEKWTEAFLIETKTLMNASPDHSDDQIAGIDEYGRTFGRVRLNQKL